MIACYFEKKKNPGKSRNQRYTTLTDSTLGTVE